MGPQVAIGKPGISYAIDLKTKETLREPCAVNGVFYDCLNLGAAGGLKPTTYGSSDVLSEGPPLGFSQLQLGRLIQFGLDCGIRHLSGNATGNAKPDCSYCSGLQSSPRCSDEIDC